MKTRRDMPQYAKADGYYVSGEQLRAAWKRMPREISRVLGYGEANMIGRLKNGTYWVEIVPQMFWMSYWIEVPKAAGARLDKINALVQEL